MGGSARTAALVRLISSQCSYSISTAAPLGFSQIACREFSTLPAAGKGTAATQGASVIACQLPDGNSTHHTKHTRVDWLQHRIAALPWRPSALGGWSPRSASSPYGPTSSHWSAMAASDEERKGEQHQASQDGTLMPLDRPSVAPAANGLAAAKQLMPAAGLSAAQLACAEPGLALLSFMTPFGRGSGGFNPLNFNWRGDPTRAVTNAIIATNIAIYALEHSLTPGLTNALCLYNWGVAHGQWWRLLTCAFTHSGLLHLIINSVSIHFICPSVEAASGRARFLGLYLGAALAGSLASYYSHSIYHAAAGSSGAIFGMLGALLAFKWSNRGHVYTSRDEVLSLLQVVGLNLLIGYAGHSFVDNAGHIGGLLGGSALMLLAGPRYRWVHDEYGSRVVDKPLLPLFGRGTR